MHIWANVAVLVLLVAPSFGAHLPYIIGGNDVTDASKWPWQGSLRNGASHSCGCSLISATWVISAAHCLGGHVSQYTIILGTVDRHDGQLIAPKQIIRHEDYGSGPGSTPNDIALISIPAVTLTDKVSPVPLATTEEAGNSDCWISGWGRTATGYALPDTLQEAHMDVYTNTMCKYSWGSKIQDWHVCIGKRGKGSCSGDSGGPLVCKVDGKYQLVGITSWGIRGCYTDYPSVYTRVAYYKDWIRENSGVE